MLEVVCAVMRRGERVLLCQRADGTHLAGHWEFPGGKVEPGEKPREALQREITEELGCRIEVTKDLPTVDHLYPELAIRLRPFLCEIAEGEPTALEHEAIGWFAPSEWPALGLAGADRKIADALLENK